MIFADAVKTCFRKYITFSGRASRAEFWWFVLFLLLMSVVLVVINTLIYGPEITTTYRLGENGQPVGPPLSVRKTYQTGWFGTVFFLMTFLPWLAVGWRRLHDSDRAGYLPWLTVFGLVLFVFIVIGANVGFGEMFHRLYETGHVRVNNPSGGGAVFLAFIGVFATNIYWLTRPSTPGPNSFGPNPLEVSQ